MRILKPCLWTALLAGYFYFSISLAWVWRNATFYMFQGRDLERASKLLAGRPIFFGPEMTGGGNLPGPLYYLTLALSQIVNPSWISAWWELLFLVGAGGIAGWLYFRSRYGEAVAFLWLALFGLSGAVARSLLFFLNVSYILPFLVVGILSAASAFAEADARARARSFQFAAFISGLSLQFHFTGFCVFVALVLMQALGPRAGLPRVTARTFVRGTGLFVLPSVPYFLWWLLQRSGIHLGQPPFYAGHATSAPTSLLWMLDYISAGTWWETVEEVVFHLTSSVPLPLILMMMTAGVALVVRLPKLPTSEFEKRQTRALLIATGVGFVPFAYCFFAAIGVRYGFPFGIAASALTAAYYPRLSRSVERVKIYCALSGVSFIFMSWLYFWSAPERFTLRALISALVICVAPLAYLFVRARAQRTAFVGYSAGALALTLAVVLLQGWCVKAGDFGYTPILMPRRHHWTEIWQAVYRQTGWSYDESIHRIYFLNHHIEQDPHFIYDEVVAEPTHVTIRKHTPDGFFVAFAKEGVGMTPALVRDYILKQSLQSDVRRALENGDLQVGPSLTDHVLVAPFRVRNPDKLARHFHDYGEAYSRDPAESLLDRFVGSEAVGTLAAGDYVFKWNECAEAHPFCSTGARIRLSRDGERVRLDVKVMGAALSQVSAWISPTWTQAWNEPYVEITCGGERLHFKLADSIGYKREFASDPRRLLLSGNNSLVAPFVREFEFACAAPMRDLRVGRASSSVESIYNLQTLPARELTLAAPEAGASIADVSDVK